NGSACGNGGGERLFVALNGRARRYRQQARRLWGEALKRESEPVGGAVGRPGSRHGSRVGGPHRAVAPTKKGRAMRIERRYTKEGRSSYAAIEFRLTQSEIRNPDGSVVFHAKDVEVPSFWSQVAADVLAQKYFRKAGVPARLKKIEEETVPSWLWRSTADEAALALLPEK